MTIIPFPTERATRRTPTAPSATAEPMTLDAAMERFYEHRSPKVTKGTLRTYRNRLAIWLAWREQRAYSPFLRDIAIEEFRALLVYLTEEHIVRGRRHPKRLEPASIDGTYRVLQTFWNFLAADDLLTDAQARFFQGDRLSRPVVPDDPRPVYSTEDLEQLLAAFEEANTPEETARNRAVITMLYETGSRITEVCSLDDKDVDFTERTGIVLGKGRKHRFIFWTHRTAEALDEYLALRRGGRGGPLFRTCGNDPAVMAISADSFRIAVKRSAKRAGLELFLGAPVHAFRHAFARRFLDAGGEGLHLQQLLGHASMQTTERYVKENAGKLRTIYRRIFGE